MNPYFGSTPRRGQSINRRCPEKPRYPPDVLMSHWFQDRGIALVGGDDSVELLQVVHAIHWDGQLLDLKDAGVAEYVAVFFCLAMVGGKVVVGIHRRGKIVYFVACGERNFEKIGVVFLTVELHRGQ